MKFANYILTSENKENSLLYLMNSQNGCTVRIPTKIFKNFNEILKNNQMIELLKQEGFFDDYEDAYERSVSRETTDLNLTLLIHENCNFRCTYCYEKFEKNAMSKEIMDAIVGYIDLKIKTERLIENVHISWFGGEPLLNLQGIEYISKKVIKLCDSANVRYSSDITTNGFLLSEKVYRKLTNLKVTNYQITVDGEKQYHDSQRILKNGKGTFDRIIENLNRIKNYTNDKNLIVLRTNVGVDNIDSMEKHIKNLVSLFGSDDRFDLTYHNIGDWGETCIDVLNSNVALELSELTVELGGRSEGLL